jgi:glycosyltransferase involved in cell wall biosynthesis
VVISIPFDKRSYTNAENELTKIKSTKDSGRTFRNILGRYKYFLKTTLQWFSFSIQLIIALKKNRITTVYTIWQGGIWGRIWYKWLGVKIVYGANSNLEWHLEKNLLNRFDSQYRILRDANHVDFLSSGLIYELYNMLPAEDFPNKYSVSPCSFINYINYYPEYPKDDSVVFMGRLVALKNPILFLKAVKIFNKLHQQPGKIKFMVLGTGPFEGEMKDFISKNSLTNVFMEGKVSTPEKYLQKSKVFIAIQQTENYPSQALMEAMACENAVIASDVGETRKIVTETEGVLVKLDADKIAQALIKLLADNDTRLQKGQSARERVMREHSIEKFTNYFLNLMS